MIDFKESRRICDALPALTDGMRWMPYSEEGPNKTGGQLHSVCAQPEPGPLSQPHECVATSSGPDELQAYNIAVFIAHAREALPAALDEIDRLQADNKKLRTALDATVAVMLDGVIGEKSVLGSHTKEERANIVMEVARMAAEALGMKRP